MSLDIGGISSGMDNQAKKFQSLSEKLKQGEDFVSKVIRIKKSDNKEVDYLEEGKFDLIETVYIRNREKFFDNTVEARSQADAILFNSCVRDIFKKEPTTSEKAEVMEYLQRVHDLINYQVDKYGITDPIEQSIYLYNNRTQANVQQVIDIHEATNFELEQARRQIQAFQTFSKTLNYKEYLEYEDKLKPHDSEADSDIWYEYRLGAEERLKQAMAKFFSNRTHVLMRQGQLRYALEGIYPYRHKGDILTSYTYRQLQSADLKEMINLRLQIGRWRDYLRFLECDDRTPENLQYLKRLNKVMLVSSLENLNEFDNSFWAKYGWLQDHRTGKLNITSSKLHKLKYLEENRIHSIIKAMLDLSQKVDPYGFLGIYKQENFNKLERLHLSDRTIRKDCIKEGSIDLLELEGVKLNKNDKEKLKISGKINGPIPLYIKSGKRKSTFGRWQFKFENMCHKPYVADKYHCDWVFVDILPELLLAGIYLFKYSDNVCACLCLPCDSGTARYVSIDQPLYTLPKEVNFLAYRHLLGDLTYDYNCPLSWINLITKQSYKDYNLSGRGTIGDTVEYYKGNPVPKIFREDQIFINDEILLNKWNKLNKPVVHQLINVDRAVSKLLVYGLIIYLHNINEEYLWIIKMTGLLDAKNDEEFIHLGKQLSDRAKTLHQNSTLDMRPLFEIHNLVNRTVTDIDWEQEFINRTETNTAQVPTNYVYENAKKIFIRGRIIKEPFKGYETRSWKSFWARRLEWGTTGAFFSSYKEDYNKLKRLDKDYRNKLFFFINEPSLINCTEYLERKPALHARTSIKYEWAKQRAIYGTDITNYVITQFVMQNCEELLPKEIAIGSNSKDEIVRRKVNYILENKTPCCLDFEDFNSQHSINNMRAVICAFIDTWRDKMSDEQLAASDWLLSSIGEQVVHDDIGLKQMYVTQGTLLSGWRLTSFVNSILNKVYFSYVQGGLKKEHISIHSGDDIIAGVVNLRQIQTIHKRCKLYNIRLSPLKCFLGSVAEFLRIDHKSKGQGQYIARSIATLVAGKIENKPAFNIRDVIEAMYERIQQVIKRGGNREILRYLLYAQIKNLSKKFKTKPEHCFELLTTNRIQGGISDLADIKGFRYCIGPVEGHPMTVQKEIKYIMPGIVDYVQICLKPVSDMITIEKDIKKYVQSKLITSFARIPHKLTKQELTKEEYKQDKRLLPHKGKCKDLIDNIPEYGRIKLIGCTIEAIKALGQFSIVAANVMTATDPLRFMQVILQ